MTQRTHGKVLPCRVATGSSLGRTLPGGLAPHPLHPQPSTPSPCALLGSETLDLRPLLEPNFDTNTLFDRPRKGAKRQAQHFQRRKRGTQEETGRRRAPRQALRSGFPSSTCCEATLALTGNGAAAPHQRRPPPLHRWMVRQHYCSQSAHSIFKASPLSSMF